MLLLYPREILILDLELSQTVGVVAIERSGVPFTQVKQLHNSVEWESRCGLSESRVLQRLIRLLSLFFFKVRNLSALSFFYLIGLIWQRGVLAALLQSYMQRHLVQHKPWHLYRSRRDNWQGSCPALLRKASYITIFTSPEMNSLHTFYFYSITRKALPKLSLLFFFFKWMILPGSQFPLPRLIKFPTFLTPSVLTSSRSDDCTAGLRSPWRQLKILAKYHSTLCSFYISRSAAPLTFWCQFRSRKSGFLIEKW